MPIVSILQIHYGSGLTCDLEWEQQMSKIAYEHRPKTMTGCEANVVSFDKDQILLPF